MVLYTDNRGKSTANTCQRLRAVFIRLSQALRGTVSHDNCADRRTLVGDASFKFLPHQLDSKVEAYCGGDG